MLNGENKSTNGLKIKPEEVFEVFDAMTNLRKAREELLREYILSSGSQRAVILRQILDLDEQIEEEQAKQYS